MKLHWSGSVLAVLFSHFQTIQKKKLSLIFYENSKNLLVGKVTADGTSLHFSSSEDASAIV